MLLDYKDIIIKHYALGMSGREIAEELSVSKSGVNKFLAAFKECKTLSYEMRHLFPLNIFCDIVKAAESVRNLYKTDKL